MPERECVNLDGTKIEEPEPEGWIEEMVKDIDAMFKKYPDMKLYKTMEI